MQPQQHRLRRQNDRPLLLPPPRIRLMLLLDTLGDLLESAKRLIWSTCLLEARAKGTRDIAARSKDGGVWMMAAGGFGMGSAKGSNSEQLLCEQQVAERGRSQLPNAPTGVR